MGQCGEGLRTVMVMLHGCMMPSKVVEGKDGIVVPSQACKRLANMDFVKYGKLREPTHRHKVVECCLPICMALLPGL